MTALEIIERKLREGMVQGEMHGCLRDVGRLAGGYAATGAVSSMDLYSLEQLAVSLSANANEGRDKWAKAVVFGRAQPIDWRNDGEYVAPKDNRAIGWNEEIGGKTEPRKIVDENQIHDVDVIEPGNWNPKNELIQYLSTLFNEADHVGYVTDSWERDGKAIPSKGCFNRTAGELIEGLRTAENVSDVFGPCKPEVGAWIRFNPLDSSGVCDANVTDLRYALIECDTMPIPRQHALLKKLELPIVTLVHSGNKSLHAVIHIGASDLETYSKRVDFLYAVCAKNGLEIDKQNRNPSRLSRMPGVTRAGAKQFLLGTKLGRSNWGEWESFITDDEGLFNINIEDAADYIETEPPASDPVLVNYFDVADKVALIGKSKSKKTFILTQMAICIATGRRFFGWDVARPRKILFIQLEVKSHHFHRRVHNVARGLGVNPESIRGMIKVVNGRGKGLTALKILRLAKRVGADVICIDPVYKIFQGSENDAEQWKPLLDVFDTITEDMNATVIYSLHDKKGHAGGMDATDRGAGSGIAGRDYDAALTITNHADHATDPDLRVIEAVKRNYADDAPITVRFDGSTCTFSVDGEVTATPMTANTERTRQRDSSVSKVNWDEISDVLANEIHKNRVLHKYEVFDLGVKLSGRADKTVQNNIKLHTIASKQGFVMSTFRNDGVSVHLIGYAKDVKTREKSIVDGLQSRLPEETSRPDIPSQDVIAAGCLE